MTEPQRLKDKYAGELEGALLRSARGDAPSARSRGRAFAALGVGSAIAAGPAATTAAVGATGAKAVASVGLFAAVKWGGIGLAVGALTVGGIQQVPKMLAGGGDIHMAAASAPTFAATAPSEKIGPGAAPEVPLAPEPVEVATAVPPSPVVPRAAAPSDPRALPPIDPMRSSPPGAKAAVPAELLAESGLADEVAALDRARRLAAGDPDRALALLDEYDRRFPRGDLAPEALVLRIEALVRGGERARAETLARSYLQSHPRSPHAKRIRTIVGWSDDTP
jgi:hypothetical protein